MEPVADVHGEQAVRKPKGGHKQIVLILIASGDEGVDTARVGIQKLVSVPLVLYLEVFDYLVGLVADKDVDADELAEAPDGIIDCLGLVADLDVVILE